MTTNLDDAGIYGRLDPAGMRDRIREMPRQCLKGWQKGSSLALPGHYSDVNKVVILGMGGSAIGADLLASFPGKAPILVHRDYDLPPFVDADTLIIASSYSGNTEETLSGFGQALGTPAKKLVITSGGLLKERAEREGIPTILIDYQAPPRAALAHSFMPLLGVCCKLGIVADKSCEVSEMALLLEKLLAEIDENRPLASNPAKQLATKLRGQLAVIYGAGFLSQVARRWKTQLNENAKALAISEVLPELTHNAIVGYQFPADLTRRLLVVMLQSRALPERTLLRYRITGELLSKANVRYEIVEGTGKSHLSQMMSLVLFGDWVSYYLALLYETDPSPVQVIDDLKKKLAEST